MTLASAPGKIILFGEHAVVYGRPALAIPVTQIHADVEIQDSQRTGIWLAAPDISLSAKLSTLPSTHALRCAVEAFFQAVHLPVANGLTIHITSSIPVAAGLGSGAAVSAALIRALSAHTHHALSTPQINELCYNIEKIHHGTPSGIDNTVITSGQPVYFVKGQPIQKLHVKTAFTLVIADTGVPASTKEAVSAVRKLWESDQAHWNTVFDQIAVIVYQARLCIESGETAHLGGLMDANQALLMQMGVSSKELERLVQAAKTSGALGAKLSGGGRGGNMIALATANNAQTIANALLTAQARRVIITQVQ